MSARSLRTQQRAESQCQIPRLARRTGTSIRRRTASRVSKFLWWNRQIASYVCPPGQLAVAFRGAATLLSGLALSLSWPDRALNLIGEFDPGSGRTLAACLTHASRTVRPLRGYTSGERVSNTWATCPQLWDNSGKPGLIPDTTSCGISGSGKFFG